MWVFQFFHDFDIVKLDVQELIHRLEGTADGNVILKLDRDLLLDKGFEETGRVIYISDQTLVSGSSQTIGIIPEEQHSCRPIPVG